MLEIITILTTCSASESTCQYFILQEARNRDILCGDRSIVLIRGPWSRWYSSCSGAPSSCLRPLPRSCRGESGDRCTVSFRRRRFSTCFARPHLSGRSRECIDKPRGRRREDDRPGTAFSPKVHGSGAWLLRPLPEFAE